VRRTAAVERTRAAIEAAALELFERDGYDATHVTHVADAAGVSRRTVFRHFPRKEDLVFSDADDDTAAVLEALAARPEDEPAGRALVAAMRDASAAFDRDLTMLRSRVIDGNALLLGRTWMVRRQWIDAVAGGLLQRDLHDLATARAIAEVGAALLGEAMRRWAADADEAPLHDHVDAVASAVVAHLC